MQNKNIFTKWTVYQNSMSIHLCLAANILSDATLKTFFKNKLSKKVAI